VARRGTADPGSWSSSITRSKSVASASRRVQRRRASHPSREYEPVERQVALQGDPQRDGPAQRVATTEDGRSRRLRDGDHVVRVRVERLGTGGGVDVAAVAVARQVERDDRESVAHARLRLPDVFAPAAPVDKTDCRSVAAAVGDPVGSVAVVVRDPLHGRCSRALLIVDGSGFDGFRSPDLRRQICPNLPPRPD